MAWNKLKNYSEVWCFKRSYEFDVILKFLLTSSTSFLSFWMENGRVLCSTKSKIHITVTFPSVVILWNKIITVSNHSTRLTFILSNNNSSFCYCYFLFRYSFWIYTRRMICKPYNNNNYISTEFQKHQRVEKCHPHF